MALKPNTGLSTLPGFPFLCFFPELMDFKSRRVSSFRKNLIELAELELKHAKVSSPSLPGPPAASPTPRPLGSYQVSV